MRQRPAGTRKGTACPPRHVVGLRRARRAPPTAPPPATCPRKNRSPVPAAGGPGVFPCSLPNPPPPSSGHQPDGGEGTRTLRCVCVGGGWPSCRRRTCPAAHTCAPRAAPSALTAAAPGLNGCPANGRAAPSHAHPRLSNRGAGSGLPAGTEGGSTGGWRWPHTCDFNPALHANQGRQQ